MPILNLTDEDFHSTIKNNGLVVVDFYADWCGPCKMQEPIIEELAKEANDKFLVAKLNVDQNQDAATKYEVMSIPTIIIFKDGEIAERFIGMQSKDTLLEKINNLFK